MLRTDGELATNLLFDVWLVSRATNALLDAALEPAGLTADEFAVYSVLRAGPLTPTELAEWMAAPLTTVSSYVKRFEARGHVTRTANPHDGRSYRLTLTRQGTRAHEDAGARFLPVLSGVEAALGRSPSTVQNALAALRRALATVRSEGSEPGAGPSG
jgi:DNA-binding MarR family transcriptional regulator